jgi:hypothetical protein
MLGMLGGPWKLAGRPLGRLPCVLLACCTPGGGAVPGADMPGGGPEGTLAQESKEGAVSIPIPGGGPMPGGAPLWPGKAPNPGGRPNGDAVHVVSKSQSEELRAAELTCLHMDCKTC